MKLSIYASTITDACAAPTSGWGMLIQRNDEMHDFTKRIGGESNCKVSRMDVQVGIAALQMLNSASDELAGTLDAHIVTTSKHLFTGVTQWVQQWKCRGWTKKCGGVPLNLELWQALNAEMEKLRHPVTWHFADLDEQDELEENRRKLAIATRDLAIDGMNHTKKNPKKTFGPKK